jgi:hypothetical protein
MIKPFWHCPPPGKTYEQENTFKIIISMFKAMIRYKPPSKFCPRDFHK